MESWKSSRRDQAQAEVRNSFLSSHLFYGKDIIHDVPVYRFFVSMYQPQMALGAGCVLAGNLKAGTFLHAKHPRTGHSPYEFAPTQVEHEIICPCRESATAGVVTLHSILFSACSSLKHASYTSPDQPSRSLLKSLGQMCISRLQRRKRWR